MTTELLAPVGNQAMLAAAINAGADAVYLGITDLNMRKTAKNFQLSQLAKVVQQCHNAKVKVYLTINTIIYNNELNKVQKILQAAKQAKIDAIICWDLAVINSAKKLGLEIHLSTQASVANAKAAELYKKLGVKRFVLARECSLEQVKELAKQYKVEVFCHGAMCVSESGRCFISQFTQNCSANRGECLQPCRRKYEVRDVEENHTLILDGNYIMSAKDLCTIEFLDKLISAGVCALKIEGRAKSADYVYCVVSVYREAIDLICSGKKPTKQQTTAWLNKLKTVYNKGFSTGFYLGKPINEWSHQYGSSATLKKEYVGVVTKFFSKLNVAEVKLENSSLSIGDKVRFIGSTTGAVECEITSLELNINKPIKTASKGKLVGIKLPFRVRPSDKCFKLISAE